MEVVLRSKRHWGWRIGAAAAGMLLIALMLCFRNDVRDAFVDDTRYAAGIREAAVRHGLPPPLVRSLIFRESRFNPRARGKAGEVGLMQVLPAGAAAEWARIRKRPVPTVHELYDVKLNLEIGCFYLARCMRRWRDYRAQMELALCDYNAGTRRANQWRPADRSEPDILPRITIRSTREYVKTIMMRYRRYCMEMKKR